MVIRHTKPAGIRDNICHPESTIPIEWLLDHGVDCVGSIIDSPEPEVWARAQRVIAIRHSVGILTHLVWNSESAGTGAWPHPHTAAEEVYLNRWRSFMQGCPGGAVVSATAGNEGSTPGWVTTEGEPITIGIMAATAEAFANASARFGVQPWATSIHTAPVHARDLARAVRGLCHGVPYHPYYRSLRGRPSTPDVNILGRPDEWRYGTVEAVADLFADSEIGYPDDVACMFDELGCPTVYDDIGEDGQRHFVEGVIRFDHPKIDRLLYFGGPWGVVPEAELEEGKDFYIIGQPQGLAEAAFINPRRNDPVPDDRVFDVGTGLLAMMADDGAKPITDSTFLPLGRHPAYLEESMGDNGIIYRWSLIQNKGYRYRP